jgi:hypothetical protein
MDPQVLQQIIMQQKAQHNAELAKVKKARKPARP